LKSQLVPAVIWTGMKWLKWCVGIARVRGQTVCGVFEVEEIDWVCASLCPACNRHGHWWC